MSLSVDNIVPTNSGSEDYFLSRAFIKFNGTTATPTINNDGNVSTITDGGVGIYQLNFTNSLTDSDYSVCGFSCQNDNNAGESITVSQNLSDAHSPSALGILVTENTTTRVDRADYAKISIMVVR